MLALTTASLDPTHFSSDPRLLPRPPVCACHPLERSQFFVVLLALFENVILHVLIRYQARLLCHGLPRIATDGR